MILVRPYREDDLLAIQAMHKAMGFDYEQPDWGKMLVSAVIEVDGKPEMAAFLRKTAETFLVMDPLTRSKRQNLAHLLILHRELNKPAKRVGLSDSHCWLPPEIDKDFGKLLLHIGWKKQLWPSYCLQVK